MKIWAGGSEQGSDIKGVGNTDPPKTGPTHPRLYPPPNEHCGCLSCRNLDSSSPESELKPVSMYTDSDRLDPVLFVSSPSLEDEFFSWLYNFDFGVSG